MCLETPGTPHMHAYKRDMVRRKNEIKTGRKEGRKKENNGRRKCRNEAGNKSENMMKASCS